MVSSDYLDKILYLMALEDQKPIMQRNYAAAITGASISMEEQPPLNEPQTPPQPSMEEPPIMNEESSIVGEEPPLEP